MWMSVAAGTNSNIWSSNWDFAPSNHSWKKLEVGNSRHWNPTLQQRRRPRVANSSEFFPRERFRAFSEFFQSFFSLLSILEKGLLQEETLTKSQLTILQLKKFHNFWKFSRSEKTLQSYKLQILQETQNMKQSSEMFPLCVPSFFLFLFIYVFMLCNTEKRNLQYSL